MRFPMIVVLAVLIPAPLPAQTDGPDAEAEVLAVVERLFDGMRAGDSTMVRSTLDPSARLVSAFEREGEPVLQSEPMDGFIAAVGEPHDRVWDERIWDTEVEIDGRLAAVWTKYAFYLGSEFSHCGVDAIHLFRGEDGWRIFHIADTRRREGCESPPG